MKTVETEERVRKRGGWKNPTMVRDRNLEVVLRTTVLAKFWMMGGKGAEIAGEHKKCAKIGGSDEQSKRKMRWWRRWMKSWKWLVLRRQIGKVEEVLGG